MLRRSLQGEIIPIHQKHRIPQKNGIKNLLHCGDFCQLPDGNDLLHQALQQSLRSLHFTARHHICHDKILNGIPIHDIIRICKKKRTLAATDAKLTHNDITAVAKGFLHHLFIFLQLLLYLHPFSPPNHFS